MAINDLIPGSLAWMLFNMSKVHPVYDTAQSQGAFITDDTNILLTADDGVTFIVSDNFVQTQTLIRWA